MNLSSEQVAELRALAADRHVTADVALRARIANIQRDRSV